MIDFLERVFRWLVARIGAVTIVQLAILWLALGTMGGGMHKILPALKTVSVTGIVFMGVLLGWLLARWKLTGWVCGPLGVAIGAAGLLLTIDRMSIPVKALLHAWYLALAQHVLYPHIVDTENLAEAWKTLGEAFSTLAVRFSTWFAVVSRGNIVTDPIITALLWAMALWLVAFWAGWAVRRWRLALPGLLPAIALLTYTLYYTNSLNVIPSLVILGGALVLLQGASGYAAALQRWQNRQVDRADVELEVSATIFGIAVLLAVAGLLLPRISFKDISEHIHDYIEARRNENLAESLGMEQTPSFSSEPGVGQGGVQVIGPSSVLDIHGGPDLSADIIFYVSVEGYEYIPPEAQMHADIEDTSPRLYWRGQTYSYYRGSGWLNQVAYSSDFEAGAPILPELTGEIPVDLMPVQQHVRFVDPRNEAVFVAGEFVTVDQPYHVYWREGGEPINIEAGAPAYTAESLVPYVKVQQLREAGSDYPESIRRYLQLPEKFPQRVRDLALDLTAALPTPYDQAIALEAYLRDFPYTLDVPGPPTGRDVADFFLFDLQKGYCNYYATAMAVMARAAGIPSRLVTGFATGSYVEVNGEFAVSANNAHAWVEIYFPGIGWVEFEPTAGLAPINRPQGEEEIYSLPPLVKPSDKASSPQAILRRIWLERALRYMGMGGVLLVFLYLLPVESWVFHALPPGRTLRMIYRRLYRLGRRWKIETDPSRTPVEFSVQIARKLKESMMFSPKLLASLTTDLDLLTGIYVGSLYGPRETSRVEKNRAIRAWYHLRRRLRWEQLKRILDW